MADEQGIKVATYHNIAFDGAWKGRSRGIWGVAAVGLLLGAAVGLAVPFVTALFGTTLALTLPHIAASIAIFSGIGMSTGMAGGLLVGTSAGAAASVVKEIEKRDLKREKIIEDALGVSIPSPVPEEPEKTEARYFNPKVSALFAVIGAVAGLVMAAAFFASGAALPAAAVPAIEAVLGTGITTATHATAITAYFTAVMTCFGAIFGTNAPKMATDMQNFAGRLLSGELLGTSWEKETEHAPQIAHGIAYSTAIPQNIPPAPLPSPVFINGNQQVENENPAEYRTNHAAKLSSHGKTISYLELVQRPTDELATKCQL